MPAWSCAWSWTISSSPRRLDLLDALDVDEVPIAVTVIGGGSRAVGRLPAFPTPERAATAMSLACGWAAWRGP